MRVHVTMDTAVTPSPVGPILQPQSSHVTAGLAGRVPSVTRKVSNLLFLSLESYGPEIPMKELYLCLVSWNHV